MRVREVHKNRRLLVQLHEAQSDQLLTPPVPLPGDVRLTICRKLTSPPAEPGPLVARFLAPGGRSDVGPTGAPVAGEAR